MKVLETDPFCETISALIYVNELLKPLQVGSDEI